MTSAPQAAPQAAQTATQAAQTATQAAQVSPASQASPAAQAAPQASAQAAPQPMLAPRLTSAQALQIANRAGLREMGVRPPLWQYLKDTWASHAFIWNLSASRAYTRNQGSYLGQIWNILSPTLEALVFIIVFGFLFGARRDVENIASFIIIGTLSYSFFARTVTAGSAAIQTNLDLIRSHQFPRSIVPAATALTEIVLFAPAVVTMVVISFLSSYIPGEGFGPVYPRLSWLLIPFAVLLLALFSTGVAFFIARLGARTPDITNVLPFFLSLGRFGSGVMFPLATMISPAQQHTWWGRLIQHQPIAVYLDLIRACFGNEPTAQLTGELWVRAILWALAAFGLGLLFFWRSEEVYGRD